MTEDDPSKRQDPRDSVMLTAVVRPEQSGAFSTRVRNISAGGIMVDCPRVLPAGTPVQVTLRGVGDVTGTVAWAAAGRVGIRFECAIDPKVTMPHITIRKERSAPNRAGFRRPGFKLSDD
jgi:hypothetical protein